MANQQDPVPRLFIAIPLTEDTKAILAKRCATLSRQLPFRRWVHPEDVHLTLQFLGPVPAEKVKSIIAALEEISRDIRRFPLSAVGLGTFGSKQAPRILWTGVEGDMTALHRLQRKVTQVMEPLGFPVEERPYRPHITLAKHYRGNVIPEHFLQQAEENGIEGPLPWTADRLVLYESHLGHSPMYKPLTVIPLKE
jgi:2'-5' RNA ligase